MEENYIKTLVQNYIKANTNSWDLSYANNLSDISDLCKMMSGGFAWLIEMCFATDISLDELMEWANELVESKEEE